MSATAVLVTGGNRGIGKGLVEHYLALPNHTVIAAVRNPQDQNSAALSSLPTGKGTKLIVVKIDALSENDPLEAVELLKSKYDISKLDIVIANAGVVDFTPAAELPAKVFQNMLAVNLMGPFFLFQATWPLMQAAKEPKFIPISTAAASIGGMEDFPMPVTAYGSSKAALNFMTKKIHIENPKLIAFPMNPGWVQTDMGNGGAKAAGMEEAPVTLKQSIDGMTQIIDTATRESVGGTFQSFDGVTPKW